MKKLEKITKAIKTVICCGGLLFFSHHAIAGDLENNNIEITVSGKTSVATPMNGGGSVGWGVFSASADIGGSTIVNGLEISCATVFASCGNNNNFQANITGETNVDGTDAVVNGARLISGNALFD